MGYTIRADRSDGGRIAFDPDLCLEFSLPGDQHHIRTLYHKPGDGKADYALWIYRERYPGTAVRNGVVCSVPGLIEGQCRIVTAEEAREMFGGAGKDIPPELADSLKIRPTGNREAGPFLHESDCEIVDTLRAIGHRLTTTKLLGEMDKRGLDPSESTVKKRLAEMVKDKRLNKDAKAKPRGYGLPEWHSSAGSRGS